MSSQEQQDHHSFDGFIDSLEKRARSARTVSIAITIGTITLAALTLFFTIRQIRQQISKEQDALNSLKVERQKTQDDLARLKQEYDATVQQLNVSRDLSHIALAQLPEEKQEALIKKAVEINQTPSDSPKVYLQILDNTQREQANGIGNRLKNAGFKFQGVEWVRVPVTLKQTQVKYFRSEFADEAQKITALLKQSGIQATPVGISTGAGQIEVWFSADAFPSKSVDRPQDKDPDQRPGPTGYGTLLGSVIDAETKRPIAGAKIQLVEPENGVRLETSTDAKGSFQLAKIPIYKSGVYMIAATHPDYLSTRRPLNIAPNQPTNMQGWALQKRKPAAQPK
jgi:hypothetical protein